MLHLRVQHCAGDCVASSLCGFLTYIHVVPLALMMCSWNKHQAGVAHGLAPHWFITNSGICIHCAVFCQALFARLASPWFLQLFFVWLPLQLGC